MNWNLKDIFPNKLLIGLTGGIASGKSLAGSYFAALGLPLFDTDLIYHDLLQSSRELAENLVKTFGTEIMAGGSVSRSLLSKKVFGDPRLLPRLNEITHPLIARALIEHLKAETSNLAIIEATLLFESGLNKSLDAVITVTAPPKVRLLRLMERNNLSREEAEKRLLVKNSDEYRVAQSNYIIQNNGSRDELNEAVKKLAFILREKAKEGLRSGEI